MSRSLRLRVLSYDISNSKHRRKVARILEDVTSRVQYSVFEGQLSKKVLEKTVKLIEPLLEQGDSLRVYTVGKSGEKQSTVIGSGVPIEKNVGYWLL